MTSNELASKIIDIKGLVNVNELKFYKVHIVIDNKRLPYTGLSEDKLHNRVYLYSNKTRKEYNLLNMLTNLKRCSSYRHLIFTKDYHSYLIRNIHIDSKNYIFSILV